MAVRSVSVRYSASVGQLVSELGRAERANAKLATSADEAGKKQDQTANRMARGGAVIALGLGVAVAKFAEFDAAMSGAAAASSATGSELNSLRDAAVKAGADTQYSATEAANAITELSKAGVSTADILSGGLTGALNLAAAGQMDVADAAETAATAMTQFKLRGDQVNHVADLLAAGAGKAQGSVGDMGMALKQAGLVASQTGLSVEETTAGLTAFASAGLIGSDAGTSFKSMLQRLTPQSEEAAGLMDELGISAYDAGGNFIGLEAFAGNLQDALKDLTPEQRNSAMATIFGSDAIRAASVLYEQGASGIRSWTNEVNQQGYAAKQAATLTDNLKGDIERLGGAFDTTLIQAGSGANDSLRTLVQTGESLIEVIGAIPGPVLTGAAAFGALALLGPKVGSMARTVTGPLSGSLSTFRSNAALAQAGAVGYGAAVEGAGQKSLTAGQRISTSFKALGGLKGAAGGVMGLLGGPWGVALTAATAGITMWAQGQADARAAADALSATIDQQTGKFTDSSRESIASSLMGDLSTDDVQLVQTLGINFNTLAEAALKGGNAYTDQRGRLSALMDEHYRSGGILSAEGQALEGVLRSYERSGAAADSARVKQDILNQAKNDAAAADSDMAGSANAAERGVSAVGDAADKTSKALDAGTDPTAAMSELLAKLGAKSKEAQDQIDGLSQALDLLGGGSRAVSAATDAQAASIDKVKEAAESAAEATKKKTSKDYSSAEKARDVAAAHRDYRAALRDVATDTLTLIDKQQSQNSSVSTLTSSYNKGRAAIESQLKAQGLHGAALQRETDKIIGTRGQFNLLLGAYKKTPGQVATNIKANGTPEAKAAVKGVQAVLNGLPNFVPVRISVTSNAWAAVGDARAAINSIGASVVGGMKRASGGAVFGPGTGTSDEIPAWLSNGEHVLTADDVKDAGGHAAIYRMRKAIQSGDLKFAQGGAVGFPGLTPGAYAAGGAVRAPLDQFYGDYIQSLGEQVTGAILAGLRAAASKAVSDQSTRIKSASTRRANTSTTLRQDRERINDAERDVRRAKSRKERLAAQKRLQAAEDKYDKDRRNAALSTIKEDKAIAAGKTRIASATKAISAAQARQRVQSQSALTKFGKSLSGGVKNTGAFIGNLEKLAGRGYGALAQQLAGMSNEDAEKIAAQAAGASKGTLDTLSKNVNTASAQQAKLDHIDTILAIRGQLVSRNMSARQMSAVTGIDVTEILDSAQLIRGDLAKNRNASRLLADLAKRSKGQLFATGGGVFGAGTETSDSIPAWLSNNEHVWTSREVRGAGGHASVERLRRAAASGRLPQFARGGPVGVVSSSGVGGIDLRALAALIRQGGGDTFNAYGIPDEAIERAIRKKEYREMSRLL